MDCGDLSVFRYTRESSKDYELGTDVGVPKKSGGDSDRQIRSREGTVSCLRVYQYVYKIVCCHLSLHLILCLILPQGTR